MTSKNTYIKDPEAILDWKFDWKPLTNGSGNSDWLAAAETITTKTITISPAVAATGLTADSSSFTDTNTSVTVWLSKGTDYNDYTVACKIVTNQARTDERSITICVRNR